MFNTMCIDVDMESLGPLVDSHFLTMDHAMVELADCILVWGGSRFLCHSQIIAANSTIFAHLVSIALNARVPYSRELLRIEIASSAPDFVRDSKRQEAFLQHIYSVADVVIVDIDEARELMKLADFFQAPRILKTVESWVCSQAMHQLQRPNLDSVDVLCTMFELAMEQRLTRLASLLLPWALQRLNRGPLADASCPIWKDVQARLDRMQRAMGTEIKALALEMQWWSCGMPQRCEFCQCRSGDLALVIHPSYLASLGSVPYVSSRSGSTCSSRIKLPESYLSVSAHMAHVLSDGAWGTTPSTSCCGNLRP